MITYTTPDQAPDEPVSAQLRRQRIADAWVQLGCCVFALLVDLLLIAVGVHLFRTGFLPTWLDGHGGTWAWFGAGAVACWWVGSETPNAISQLGAAQSQLTSERLQARFAAALGEDWDQR